MAQTKARCNTHTLKSRTHRGNAICAAFVPVHILPTWRTPQLSPLPTSENRQPTQDSSTLSSLQASVV